LQRSTHHEVLPVSSDALCAARTLHHGLDRPAPFYPSSRYDDEYVTDQFIIERGLESTNNRTITPVSDRQSDDVFITF
jgi:hypothetical protein